MTTKPISRQLKKQRELKAAGLCAVCGDPRHPMSKAFCPRCLTKKREQNRKRLAKQPKKRKKAYGGRPAFPDTDIPVSEIIRARYAKRIASREHRVETHQRWVAKYKNEIRDLREQMEQEIADHG